MGVQEGGKRFQINLGDEFFQEGLRKCNVHSEEFPPIASKIMNY